MHIDGAHGDTDVARDVTNGGGRVAAIGETLRGDRQDALAGVVLLAMPQRRIRHGRLRSK